MSHRIEGPASGVETELSRDLSLFHITMMGIGMMIGAGAFIAIGTSIGRTGPGGVLLTFSLNGLIAIFTGLSYAELSSAVPRAGGAYNYTRLGFGQSVSFLAGWMEWFASSVAGSLYAIVFATYTLRYLTELGLLGWLPVAAPVSEKSLAVLVAAVFIYINYRGVSETGATGSMITLGQTLSLAFIALVGVIVVARHPERLQNFRPFLPHGWSPVLLAMGLSYVAFEGYEVIAQTGDEAIEPRRNLPKAVLYSLLIVILTYVGIAFAAIVAVKVQDAPAWLWIGERGKTGFGDAVAELMPLGSLFVTVAVIFSSTSALNATIYSATRVSYALGRDRMLPPRIARISSRTRVPHVALFFSSGLMIGIVILFDAIEVAASASIMFLLLFFLVNLCVIRVRRNLGDELTYGFVMPFFPLLPIIAIILQPILAVNLIHESIPAWIATGAWLITGGILYVTYSRFHATETAEKIRVLQEEEAPERKPFRVLLPVGNPENALGLIRQTLKICQAKQAELHVLHMIDVPEQLPLSDAPNTVLEGEEAIVETMLYVPSEIPFHRGIRYCRNVARGIVSAAREHGVDSVVMGWRGHSRAHDFVFGSTIDPVLERAPCNVVVFKTAAAHKFKRILVPVAGGANSAFALEIASIFLEKEEGRVIPLFVHSPGTSAEPVERLIAEAKDSLPIPREAWETRIVQSRHVVGSILKEAAECDLVVIGASHERPLQQIVLGSLPETIAQRCEKPLIMVKAQRKIQSFIKKWL